MDPEYQQAVWVARVSIYFGDYARDVFVVRENPWSSAANGLKFILPDEYQIIEVEAQIRGAGLETIHDFLTDTGSSG